MNGDRPEIFVPDSPVLVAGVQRGAWLDTDGGIEVFPAKALRDLIREAPPPIVVHGRATARRLGLDGLECFDLLELFAFVRPAQPCVPNGRGILRAMGVEPPRDLEGEAIALSKVAGRLLLDLARKRDREAVSILAPMAAAGWAWAPFVAQALAGVEPSPQGIAVWKGLPQISDHAPQPPPGHMPVDPIEARRRLELLLGGSAEARPSQSDYAAAASAAFAPRVNPGEPEIMLAEAGTGVGKTAGYLAPASLWAERNEGAVWVSTYTRNLQQQIDGELDRLFPDPQVKAVQVVLRKGRENYLCLLNLEEAMNGMGGRPLDALALGLVARWTLATRDGDFTGSDFPGWLPELVGRGRITALADRRGECIYGACAHYDRCFIERSVRQARRARIVVANHALVMVQAALGGDDDTLLPRRVVFDEGHHLFDAADSAFSAALSGIEGSELRRWLLGAEGFTRSRARGLKRRVEELTLGIDGAEEALRTTLAAARCLPREGWQERLAEDRPDGPVEDLLALVRRQILARTADGDDSYGRETDLHPALDGMAEAAATAGQALTALRLPLIALRNRLLQRLVDEAEDLDSALRMRLESIGRSLMRRAILPLSGWIEMLKSMTGPTPGEFVDWLATERSEGRDLDVGVRRHWIDPTKPFAMSMSDAVHGMLITSATLRDATDDPLADWLAAEQRTGMPHFAKPAGRAVVPSQFDWPNRTRVFIVTDVRKDDLGQVAAAYRALFLASGGGALGLFTAISRLRAVHQRISGPLEEAGIPLYAQHVDAMETGSLIDMFRAEQDACLLGTDAVRDGVDVPGRSLRLILFDRVPWPRPDILHRARRAAFGGRSYDDRLTRLKLKQAFGRLIRRATDSGVFVLLDPMAPSRLLSAFPEGCPVERVGLAEAVAATRAFLVDQPT